MDLRNLGFGREIDKNWGCWTVENVKRLSVEVDRGSTSPGKGTGRFLHGAGPGSRLPGLSGSVAPGWAHWAFGTWSGL